MKVLLIIKEIISTLQSKVSNWYINNEAEEIAGVNSNLCITCKSYSG